MTLYKIFSTFSVVIAVLYQLYVTLVLKALFCFRTQYFFSSTCLHQKGVYEYCKPMQTPLMWLYWNTCHQNQRIGWSTSNSHFPSTAFLPSSIFPSIGFPHLCESSWSAVPSELSLIFPSKGVPALQFPSREGSSLPRSPISGSRSPPGFWRAAPRNCCRTPVGRELRWRSRHIWLRTRTAPHRGRA